MLHQDPVVGRDLVRPKLARGHAALEHDVHLLKGAVLGLGEAEEAPDGGQKVEGAPEESLARHIQKKRVSCMMGIELAGWLGGGGEQEEDKGGNNNKKWAVPSCPWRSTPSAT